VAELAGKAVKPFRYRDKGELATIGRSRAVGVLPPGLKLSGFVAQMTYLAVHLFYLAGRANRLMVLLTWVWSFLTYGRGARIIPPRRLVARAFPPAPKPARPATSEATYRATAPHVH
jgi:hypothetical protein